MKNNISRRQFMKAAGVSAASLAAMSMMTGCGDKGAAANEIPVGLLGPKTAGPDGDVSVYGIAVLNGANLYFNKVNEAGGINGKKLVIIEKDEQGVDTQAVTCFTQLVDEGIVGLVGDVTTTPTLAVVAESQEYNMPMVTASATAAAVTYDEESDTVYENVYRSTFIDPFQGVKMADYAYNKLGLTKAAVLFQVGGDYQEGLAANFQAKFEELGGEIVAVENFSAGDVDFKGQLTNIQSAAPELVYCPNYYQEVGSMLKQARAGGLTVPFLGGDGWDGVAEYASAEELEGCYFCANYAGGASPEFETAYEETYGEKYPNGFSPLGYDAAMTLCMGIEAAEEAGLEVGSDEYKQAIIDGINAATVAGVTGTFTFDEYNNPVKTASIITFEGGVPTYVENY